MNLERLASLGWTPELELAWNALLDRAPDWCVARVTHEERGLYRLQISLEHSTSAELSGKLRFGAHARRALPVIGDWVACTWRDAPSRATVHAVLPRRSLLTRADSIGDGAEQCLAANVDIACVAMSLNQDFNPRRLERYLSSLWNSGAQPVVLLTKSDLHPDPESAAREIESSALGAEVLAVSAQTGHGLERVRALSRPGSTLVLLGSSGVGKSTLTNALLGEERAKTQDIRAHDDRGRHTTTQRSLYSLPGGGLWIDTPGMREFGLTDVSDGIEEAFSDLTAWAQNCRFTDCAHRTEPGCAVREALNTGALTLERLESYLKLQREAAYFDRKKDKALQSREKQRWKKISAQAEQHMKRKRWNAE